MPIKFPKTFARRKSSGNALEDINSPSEPSFKVFDRRHGSSASFDGPNTLKHAAEFGGKHSSEDPDPDNIFAGIERSRPSTDNNRYDNYNQQARRPHIGKLTGSSGSGGTNNSGSTGKLYDSSSSAKFSSSSTLPSSTTETSAHDIPVPPIPESPFSFSLRASARTFSFGSRVPKVPQRGQAPTSQQAPPVNRERAMTASTSSTATPPKLLESDFNLEGSGDLGNIFDGVDKRQSQVMDVSSPSPSPVVQKPGAALRAPNVPPKDRPKSKLASLSPLQFARSNRAASPQSSSGSRTSRDSLIAASPKDDYYQSQPIVPPTPGRNFGDDGEAVRPVYGAGLNPIAGQDNRKPVDAESSSLFSSDKDFTHVPLHNPKRQPGSRLAASDSNDILLEADLAARYEEVATGEKQGTKVMTPAQFERYRAHQELNRQPSDASTRSSGSNESDDDEDEAEKRKQTLMQRKKQEAHLSVYRQQMMKVTGESAKTPTPEESTTPLEGPNSSTSNLNRRSMLDPGILAQGDSNGEDDDDVPLGILAAHGFPNKNRPPSQLMPSSSNPNLRASYQPHAQGPQSVAGDAPQAKRSSTLPVFARNLPRDPYYGAGLVNPTQRESLALGGGTPSVHGGGPPSMPPGPPGPPGGLVGVIANEERARAMRRGSPNTQAGYDGQPGSPAFNFSNNSPQMPQMHQMMGGMPQNQNGMSSTDQTQMQVSQQMTHMMQMQMQWMQQMMQMQTTQLGQQGPQMNGSNHLQPPPMNQQRPNSMVSHAPFGHNNMGPPQADQRTLSMLDPSAAAQWHNHNRQSTLIPPINDIGSFNAPGYAPSVAPSERSNVGTASRYRPVSTAPPAKNSHTRSSTFTASTLRPWSEGPTKNLSSPAPENSPKMNPAAPTIRPASGMGTNSPLNNARPPPRNAAVDDEDDDEGWAEMMKNREKRKTGWKFKKGASEFGDLYHPTAI